MRTEQGNRHITVGLGATSLLEAMNAVARAHGAMWWQVRYCQAGVRREFAEIHLFTFDMSGIGARGMVRRPDGRWTSPCSPGQR